MHRVRPTSVLAVTFRTLSPSHYSIIIAFQERYTIAPSCCPLEGVKESAVGPDSRIMTDHEISPSPPW